MESGLGPWIAWVVLAVLAVETVLLVALRRDVLVAVWPTLAAGGAIVLALGAALSGAGLAPVGALLALGGSAHAIDLVRRLRR